MYQYDQLYIYHVHLFMFLQMSFLAQQIKIDTLNFLDPLEYVFLNQYNLIVHFLLPKY